MNIYLYNFKGDDRVINKNLGDVQVEMINGTLRDDCDLIDPSFLIHSDPRGCNYAWIPEFRRYYFINDVQVIRTGLWQISCHVDVLLTYKEFIKNCDIIVTKTSAKSLDDGSKDGIGIGYNAMLVDPNIPITQTTRHRELTFDGYSAGGLGKGHFTWDNLENLYLVTVG